MRVAFDLRKCVAFIGHVHGERFEGCGTAFLQIHKNKVYLVTAAHIAESLGDDPFSICFNKPNSAGTVCLQYDPLQRHEPRARWFLHEDPNVDLAVFPFNLDFERMGAECMAVQTSTLVEAKSPMEDVGCGDICYVIGLFSKLQGENQNLPVVHTGHVALMPSRDERIETRDKAGRARNVEGYLVEIANLAGLSGAPVFVRGGMEVDFPVEGGGSKVGIMASPDLKLLGVWQGSWEGFASDRNIRVPVGMGIVTPSWKLSELLNSAPVEENLRQWLDEEYRAVED